jgi:hypothetical protein
MKRILGYMVHKSNSTHDIDTAALYPVSRKEDAIDAAMRWGQCLTPLVQSDDCPDLFNTELVEERLPKDD